jgi:integrase
VELPEHRAAQSSVWDATQVGRFLDGIAEHRLYALFQLIAFTGMRGGEALGLHWSDTNLDAQLVVVRWQVTDAGRGPALSPPKTVTGTRIIPIDSLTVEVLRGHHTEQQIERARWGAAWQDLDLVFVKEDGGLLHPDAVTHLFAKLVAGRACRASASTTCDTLTPAWH